MIINRLKTLFLALILSALFSMGNILWAQSSSSSSSFSGSANIKLQYVVNIYGADLGQISTQIIRQDDRFSIESVTKAEGAASLLMGGDLVQKCQFDVQSEKIISLSSSANKSGRDAFNNTIELDHNNNKINFQTNAEQQLIDLPAGYVVDSCNFQFAAAYTDLKFLKEVTTYVLDGKRNRVKGYVFKSQTQEELSTKIGIFETTKIVLERELNPEKQFIFWVSKEHPYFPLKMVDKRKNGSRMMSIKSVVQG